MCVCVCLFLIINHSCAQCIGPFGTIDDHDCHAHLCDHVSHVPEQQLPTGQIPVTAHLNVGHEVKQISYQDLCFLLEFLKAL